MQPPTEVEVSSVVTILTEDDTGSPFLSSFVKSTYLWDADHFQSPGDDEQEEEATEGVSGKPKLNIRTLSTNREEDDYDENCSASMDSVSDDTMLTPNLSSSCCINGRRRLKSPLTSSIFFYDQNAKQHVDIDVTTGIPFDEIICLLKYHHPYLTRIDLRDRNLNDNDVYRLVDVLEENRYVKEVILEGNRGITNSSVAPLSDLIEFNKVMTFLHLGNTGITDCNEFLTALERNHQLTTFILPSYATKQEKNLCDQMLQRNVK